jgi:hypothetical protein
MDYNIGLGMIYLADSLPEIMKQLGKDALRGDYGSRRLAFEIARLIGRNKVSVVAIQQNVGGELGRQRGDDRKDPDGTGFVERISLASSLFIVRRLASASGQCGSTSLNTYLKL